MVQYDDNASMRVRFPDSPDKFMDSEVSLATEIRKISAVAASPILLPILLHMNDESTTNDDPDGIDKTPFGLIALLLSHENTDIAGEAIRMFREVTDLEVLLECDSDLSMIDNASGRNSAGLGSTAVAIVHAIASHAPALIQNLSRLDESNLPDQESISNIVACVDNLIESTETDLVEQIVTRTKLMKWLFYRLNIGRESLKRLNIEIDGILASAADLLAGLLQISEKARELLNEKDIESLMMLLSQFRNQTHNDEDVIETLESLCSALCSAMLDRNNKFFFTQLEGIELSLLLLKTKHKTVRRSAVQLLDFALTRNTPGCERLVQSSGGLGIAFSIFSGKMKYVMSSDSEASITSRGVNIVFSLFQGLPPNSKERDRVLAKMVENDYEKCDRLVQLYFDCKERIQASVKALLRHTSAISGETLSDEDIYAARIEGGQYSLQHIAHIVAHSYATRHLGIQSRILMLLRQRGETLKDVRSVLDTYWDEIGDNDGEDAQKRRRDRLRALQMELREPEETLLDMEMENK